MNILELYAGSRSIGKVAESRGHTVFSSDIKNFGGIHYEIDILNFDTARKTGATLRKAEREYSDGGTVTVYGYDEPPRLVFWYEGRV